MKNFRWLLAGSLGGIVLSLVGCAGLVDYEGIKAQVRADLAEVTVYQAAPNATPRFDRLTALEVANGALAAMLDSATVSPCVGGAEWDRIETMVWANPDFHDSSTSDQMLALSRAIRVAGYSLDGEALDIACVSAPPVHLVVRAQTGAPVVTSYRDAHYVDEKTGAPKPTEGRPYWVQFTPADGFVRKWMGLDVEKGGVKSTEQQRRQVAIDFVDGWRALAAVPSASALVEPGFNEVAAQYRAGPADRQPPEEVRRLRVLAEAAIRDKKLIAAAKYYGSALSIAPWWPTGRFNRALIFAELKFYPEAAAEMQRYLLLVPNAANARAAQDKIYEWEAKAGG